MNKRVSIVVPVYNSHATLPKCLDSLIAQTYQDIEIICVNDKSKDNSIDVIKEYQQKDSRVILVDHEENKNAGGARNSGIKAATGTYICFVDNDDWLTPDAIEILIGESDECRIDIVAPNWCLYYNENKYLEQENFSSTFTKAECCNHALVHGYRMLGCLIRKSIFTDNALFFPEKTFFEDNAIANTVLFCANDIKPVSMTLYYYYAIEGSSSRSINLVKLVDRVKTTDMMEAHMKRLNCISEDNEEYINYRYLLFSYNTILSLAVNEEAGAKELLDIVSGKVKEKLPNKLLSDEMRQVLYHPESYCRKIRIRKYVSRIIPEGIKKLFRNSRNAKD